MVAYGYDALGRLLSESFTNNASLNLGFSYDALGRRLTQTGPLGTVTSAWDLGGRRTQLKWPDGNYVWYCYDNVGEMIQVQENTTTCTGQLAGFAYDDLGDQTGVTRGAGGVTTAYVYDPIGRLTSLSRSGASNTQSYTQIAFNPANQMVKFTTSNGAYAWNGASALTQGYAVDGQNKYTSVGSSAYAYDARANLATLVSGGPVYSYDSENRLTGKSGSPAATLAYYPDGSLWQTVGSSTTRFLYDGDQIIGEYSGANALLRRYVPGPAVDEPIVWYEGSTLTTRRWLLGDHQGSVIAWADTSGSIPNANIDTYDEYGQPGSGNSGRFQYTGQAWLPEISAYDYRARNYLPSIGRFMQTDPKGYDAGLNLYAYVEDDPVDHVDPTGMWSCTEVDCMADYLYGQRGQSGPTLRGPQSPDSVAKSQVQTPYQLKDRVPAPSRAVDGMLRCMSGCLGRTIFVTETSGNHPPHDPHTRGLAADVRAPNDQDEAMQCGANCGAVYQQNEYTHPSRGSTAPHIHLQLVPGRHGATGPYHPQHPPTPGDDGLAGPPTPTVEGCNHNPQACNPGHVQ